MLYLVGLGLGNERDITEQGLSVARRCHNVYVEAYTGQWLGSLKALEKIIGKNVRLLQRKDVESSRLVDEAKNRDVCLLVAGDPLAATTHMQLVADAKNAGVGVNVIHNASIMNAVAETGLSLYKFGRTTTLCFETATFKPTSPYEIIKANQKLGLHTLVLLDTRNGKEFMSVEQAMGLLNSHKVGGTVVACSKLGSDDSKIAILNEKNASKLATPACLVVAGTLDDKEKEFLEMWS